MVQQREDAIQAARRIVDEATGMRPKTQRGVMEKGTGLGARQKPKRSQGVKQKPKRSR